MTPIEARYFLNGEEKDKITAEDGIEVALDTPAGLARAFLRPREGGIKAGALGERFTTRFPGKLPAKEIISMFAMRGYKEKINQPEQTRSKKYATNNGEVIIELKAVNSEPPKKRNLKK